MENLEYKVGDKLVYDKGYITRWYTGTVVEVIRIRQSYGTVTVKDNDGNTMRFLMEDMDMFFSKHSS